MKSYILLNWRPRVQKQGVEREKNFHSWLPFFLSGEWGSVHRLQGISYLRALLWTAWMQHYSWWLPTVATIPTDSEALGIIGKASTKEDTLLSSPGSNTSLQLCAFLKPEVTVCLMMPLLQADGMGPSEKLHHQELLCAKTFHLALAVIFWVYCMELISHLYFSAVCELFFLWKKGFKQRLSKNIRSLPPLKHF